MVTRLMIITIEYLILKYCLTVFLNFNNYFILMILKIMILHSKFSIWKLRYIFFIDFFDYDISSSK